MTSPSKETGRVSPWDALRRALKFQDTREPKYRAPETESARPLLPEHWPTYADARAIINARDDVRRSLQIAIEHIEHMAAFITKQNAGYSFESLGEDMPGIRATLSRLKEG